MKRIPIIASSRVLFASATVALGIAASSALPAQTVDPAAAPASAEPDEPAVIPVASTDTDSDEIVVLSPFVVDASRDDGYRASATAAGSRLKTDVKDVAASLTVLTDDFMDDLGADSLADALSMVVGADMDLLTDVSDTTSGGTGYITNDRNQRENEVRVRGLGRAATTMNFVQIFSSPDRYNIERAEMLRGANSILFGLGEAAGIINYTTKQARMNWENNEVGVKIDNFGSLRTTLDFSRTLVKDRLALRATALLSEDKSMFESSFWEDERFFVTAKIKPLKSTTIDVGWETMRSEGRKPNYALPQDNVSSWLREFNNAHTTYSGDALQTFLNRNLYWDSLANSAGLASGNVPGSPDLLYDADGVLSSAQPGLYRRNLDSRNTDLLAAFAPENWDVLVDNSIFRGTARASDGTTQPSTGNPTVPAATRVSQRRNMAQSSDPKKGINRAFTDPQVIDQRIFPYLDLDLASLPGNYRTVDDDKLFVTLDQKVTDDLHFQATVQKEDYSVYYRDAITAATRQVNIDINPVTVDGRPNSNFLRPFISGKQLERFEELSSVNYILQGSYQFDFKRKAGADSWLRHLGNHRLSGLYSDTSSDRLIYQKRPVVLSSIPGVITLSQDNNNTLRDLRQLFYIGDAIQPGDTTLRYTGLPKSLAYDFDKIASANYRYYTAYPGAVSTHPNVPKIWDVYGGGVEIGTAVANNNLHSSIEAQGLGLALQSFFWDNRIVTLFGIRRDDFKQFEHTPIDSATWAQNNGVTSDITSQFWQNAYDTTDDYIVSDEPTVSFEGVETKTASVVLHVTDWMRVFANQSENFALSAPRLDNLYRPIAPQSGTTREVGIGFALFDNKLYLNLSAFESKQLRATSATGAQAIREIRNVENRLFNAMDGIGVLTGNPALDDPATTEVEAFNVKGFTFLERQPDGSVIEKPAYYDESGAPVGEYETPENVSATEDTNSTGFEVEGTFNATRNLRMQFNVSRLENEVAAIGPEIEDYLEFRSALYMQAAWLSLREDDTWGAVARARSAQATGGPLVIKRFNDLVASNYLNGIDRIGRPNPGISIYSARWTGNYQFREGKLKGLSLGANLRWESGKAIGYELKETSYTLYPLMSEEDQARIGDLDERATADPALNFDDNLPFQVPDIDKQIKGDPIVTGGLMAAYRRKLFDGRIDWWIQLNVQNLFREGGDLRVIRVNPDFSKIYGLNNPTTYQLTNTFSF